MKKENILEYIDQYLNGELSEQERTDFETQLSNDPELNLQVQKQKLANQYLMENRLSRLKNTMNSDLQSGVADKVIFRYYMVRWALGALGILILSVGTFQVWKYYRDTKEDKIVLTKEVTIKKDNNGDSLIVLDSKNNYQVPENPFYEIPQSDGLIADQKKNESKEDVKDSLIVPEEGNNSTFEKDKDRNLQEVTPVIADNKDICKDVVISINGTTTATCSGKNEGLLDLSLKGGVSPYEIGLKQDGSQEIQWKASGQTILNQLQAGRYEVVVKDKNGCINHSGEFLIKEKNCKTAGSEEYSFRPEYDEKFKFLSDDEGNIVVYDRAGKEILQSELQKENEFVWDGADRNGRLVEKGVYLFVIRYKDGNSKKGYITVY